MDKGLRVLHVEDSEQDVALLTRHLARAGYELISERVETPAAMRAALETQEWDVILCDYSMPHFNAPQALALLKEMELDLPFLIISGTVGEAAAVEAMRAGAHDYLMKDNLARLAPTIERELHEAENRQARRHAEEATRDAEEKYRSVFENPFVGIYQATPAGRFITANAALAYMKGYRSPEELLANVSDVKRQHYVDPNRYEEFKRLIEKHGEVWSFESEVYRSNRSIMWTSENTRAVWHESGSLLYYEGFVKDITENKQAVRAIRSAATILRAGLAALSVLILLEALEHFLRSFVSDAIALSIPIIFGSLAAAGITYFALKRQEALYRRTLEEIAERERSEGVRAQLTAEIESQRRRLNNIVGSVPGLVWEAWGKPDAGTQRMNFVSDYVKTMLGYSVDEWLSTPNFWLSIVHPDDREEAANIAAASFASGKTSPQQFRWIAKDGRVLWVESNYAVVADDAGQPAGLRGVTLDITERKKLEEQLRQGQKMEAIGTLAGGIAHDFNNILAAIIGYSELAQMDSALDSPVQAHLEQVLKASTRARDLVRQILTFSRQKEPEREVLQLQPIIDETLKLLRGSLPSTIEVRQNINTPTPSVLGDSTQIQQVIMNLCANAGQAMKERGGVLEIRLTHLDIDSLFANAHPELKEGPHIQLTISDSGCGMDRATQARIFEPFFTTKAPGEGTGLGLAVVHGVIKNHGGAITVYSEPGEGTTFDIYLPVYDGQADAVVHKSVPVPRGNGEHILLVDDEEALVSLGKSMLEHLGYRVTTRTDGVAALAAFRSQPGDFDLLITDQTMPHMNGADLAKALLQIKPDLPVILSTGYSTAMSSEKAKAIGIRELLFKPNTMQALGEAIRRALGEGSKE